MIAKKKIRPKDKPYYVNNKEFTAAMIDYYNATQKALEENKPAPKPSNYIGQCIMNICKGMSTKHNFSGYTWKDEMVSYALEDCMKRIDNFDPNKAIAGGTTKNGIKMSGTPNAYAFFYQIAVYAFLRVIEKENKLNAKREEIIENASTSMFFDNSAGIKNYNPNSILDKARTYHKISKDIELIEEGKFEKVGERVEQLKHEEKVIKKENKDKEAKKLELFYE